MKTLEQILANLNEEQKQLLADTINYGGWGDSDVEFANGEMAYGYGYITDEAHKGKHFERRTLSWKFKALFKALGLEGDKWSKCNDVMKWMYDWWGDGSGSVLFIHEQLCDNFENWARGYKK